MKRFKLNNKGSSFLDVMISFVILLLLVKSIGTFQTSTAQAKANARNNLVIIQTLNEVVEEAYNTKDWGELTDKTLKTDIGDMPVKYGFKKDDTIYSTDKLTITINYKDSDKRIELERSIYE